MSSDAKPETSLWFSTYAVVIGRRIFELFGFESIGPEMLRAMSDPMNVFAQLAQVPLKHVYNGLILTQVKDCLSHAQNIFTGYLTSGAGVEAPEAPGATIREELEQERLKLVDFVDRLEQEENANRLLIAESQATLIELAGKLRMGKDDDGTLEDELRRQSAIYLEHAIQMGAVFCELRRVISQEIILRARELTSLLPDYRPSDEEVQERAFLDFDLSLGETTQHLSS